MQLPAYQRDIVGQLKKRLGEDRRFIQVINGPRQSGKTTAILQALNDLEIPSIYASADSPGITDYNWIAAQWERARLKGERAILVLDEVQKIHRWDEAVKELWDADTREDRPIHVVVLGSAALLMQAGLKESLAGRFELLPCTHWSWPECSDCFGWTLDEYIYFGGYPGAAILKTDQERWAEYVRNSLIETTISRDVLLLHRVEKPAMLHSLFYLACEYAGQVLSYNKMLGQLVDAGNTTTLAHYKTLLEEAFILCGLAKWTGTAIRKRASSPKWIPLNTALITATSGRSFDEWRGDPGKWGRLIEAAVGSHLVNSSLGKNYEVYYWRERDREVDYVLRSGHRLIGIEVKNGRLPKHPSGLTAFKRKFKPFKMLLVGSGGIPVNEFLNTDPMILFKS